MRSKIIVVIGSIWFSQIVSGTVTTATAQEPDPASELTGNGVGFGIIGGSLGLGAELSLKLNQNLVLRTSVSGLSPSFGDSFSNISYDLSVDLLSAGLSLDYHPFYNGFRLSGGLRYSEFSIDGSSTVSGTLEIGNRTYNFSDVGLLKVNIDSKNHVAPYIGIGYDSTHFADRNLFLGLDIGALYLGGSDVTLSAQKNVPGLAANLGIEAKKIESDVDNILNFYPVIALSAKLRF